MPQQLLQRIKRSYQLRNSCIALDIDGTSVRMLYLRRTSDNYCVERFAVVPFIHSSSVSRAIQQAIKQMGISIKNVITAIPASLVVTETVMVPSSFNDEELEAHVMLLASEKLSLAVEQVGVDFFRLEWVGDNKEKSAMKSITIVATPRENIDTRVKMITAAGLHPIIIDVDCYARERVQNYMKSQDRGANSEVVRDVHEHVSTEHNPALVREEIQQKTKFCNPFVNMTLSQHVSAEALAEEASGLIVCCGLALRGFMNERH